jgi:hypothetical protein
LVAVQVVLGRKEHQAVVAQVVLVLFTQVVVEVLGVQTLMVVMAAVVLVY